MVLSCARQQDQKSTTFFAPAVVEAKGYVVPKDSMAEPQVIAVDESKLKKIPVGKLTSVPANTNIHPVGIPKIVLVDVEDPVDHRRREQIDTVRRPPGRYR